MSADLSTLAEVQERVTAIRDVAADFYADSDTLAETRRQIESTDSCWAQALWKDVSGLGWPSLLVPEERGGAGASVMELVGLAEETGKALAPIPLTPTAVGTFALLRCEGALALEALTAVMERGSIVSCAFREPQRSLDPTRSSVIANADADGFVLEGRKLHVPYAMDAEWLLVTANEPDSEGCSIFAVPTNTAGLELQPLRVLDGSPSGDLILSGARVGRDSRIASGAAGAAIVGETIALEQLLGAAELVGVAQRAIDLAAAYACERIAYGRPIGAFQAVKHKLVDRQAEIVVARALVELAAQDMASNSESRNVSVAMAAFYAIDTLRKAPESALQVFGGIGYTWEHNIHLFLRRAATLAALLGEKEMHREIVACHLESGR